MSELFLQLPPPRPAVETSLTIAFALAVTLHALPLMVGEPAEETIDVGIEIIECGHPEPGEDPDDEVSEPPAGEPTFGFDGGRLVPPDPPIAMLDGELYLERVACPGCSRFYDVWKVRPRRALALDRSPRVTYAELYTSGGHRRSSLLVTLERARPALERCHAPPSLTLGDRVDGDVAVDVSLAIDGNGATSNVWVSEPTELGACVSRVLTRLRFAGAPRSTYVRATLRYGTTDTSSAVFVR